MHTYKMAKHQAHELKEYAKEHALKQKERQHELDEKMKKMAFKGY